MTFRGPPLLKPVTGSKAQGSVDQVKESGAFFSYAAEPQPWWTAWQQQRSEMKPACYQSMYENIDTVTSKGLYLLH